MGSDTLAKKHTKVVRQKEIKTGNKAFAKDDDLLHVESCEDHIGRSNNINHKWKDTFVSDILESLSVNKLNNVSTS